MANPNIGKLVEKKDAYKEFLRILEEDDMPEHWVTLANALGVEPSTIANWRKRPEARKALKKGIKENLKKMKKAGRKDWRMYRDLLYMLGVSSGRNNEGEGGARTQVNVILGVPRPTGGKI